MLGIMESMLCCAGMLASDLGKAFCAELDLTDLRVMQAGLYSEGKHTLEQSSALVGSSKLRRYLPDPV